MLQGQIKMVNTYEIINTCRLCLKTSKHLNVINSLEKEIIQIVVPHIHLDIAENDVFCENCAKLLQQSFAFKSKCLEIEDSIHDFKQEDETIQVNLEKILGVKEELKSIKICRSCLGYLESGFVEINTENGLELMFKKCLPEIDLELTSEPVICTNCEGVLKSIFDFLMSCDRNEEKTQNEFNTAHECDKSVISERENSDTNNEKDFLDTADFPFNEKLIKDSLEISIEEPQVQKAIPSDNVHDDICIISDNDENGTGIIETFNKRKTRCKKIKTYTPSPLSDEETTKSHDDSDHSWVDSGSASDSSDDETPPDQKKNKRTKKQLTPVSKSVSYKYCFFGESNTNKIKRHASNCLNQSVRETNSFAERNVTPTIQNRITIIINSSPNNNSGNRSAASRNNVNISENIIIDDNTISLGAIINKSIDNHMKSVERAAEKTVPVERPGANNSVTDDECVIVETKTTSTPADTSKEKWQGIMQKDKDRFLMLTILMCNFCKFNTKSGNKMTMHQHKHPNAASTDCASAYTTMHFCVSCGKRFVTIVALRLHMSRCRPKDIVYLFQVGDVLHCTKCYFDSGNLENVRSHLVSCANVTANIMKL